MTLIDAEAARLGPEHIVVAAAAAPIDPVRVELRSGIEAIADLTPQWRRLAADCPGAVVFQNPDFVANWANIYCADGRRLEIAVVRTAGVVEAIIPFTLSSAGPIRTARLAGHPLAQYDDVLIRPAADVRRLFTAATQALRNERGVDVIQFSRVRADSILHIACGDLAVPVGPEAEAVHATFGAGGHAAYMRERSRKVRTSAGKRRRQLERMGRLEFAVAASPSEARAWTHEALLLKRLWLERSGLMSRAFLDGHASACLVAAADSRGSDVTLHVSRLTLDGLTVAVEIGFVHRDRFYLFLAAFAPELAKHSPGNVLSAAATRALAADGIGTYDMMAPMSRKKDEWSTGSVVVRDYALPLRGRGHLYLNCVSKGLRPAARAAFYGLPKSWRGWIATHTLKI